MKKISETPIVLIRNELCNGTLDLGLLYKDIGGFNGNLITHSFGNYSVVLVATPSIEKAYPDFITPNQSCTSTPQK